MINADLHVHTVYSHGEATVREVFEKAVAYGLSYIAISEHSTANMFYGLNDNQFLKLSDEIDSLKDEFLNRGLHVMKGVEMNLLGKGKVDRPKGVDFDVKILGYHRGIMPKNAFARRALMESMGLIKYGRNAKENTAEVIRALEENEVDIIAHPGEYIALDIKELSCACARLGTLIEINQRHVTLNEDALRIAADCGARFVINSDAHKKSELCCYQNAVDAASRAGVLSLVVNWRDDDNKKL